MLFRIMVRGVEVVSELDLQETEIRLKPHAL